LKTESFEHIQKIAEDAPARNALLSKQDADMKPDRAKKILSFAQNNPFIGRQNAGRIGYLAGLIELCAPDAKKPWDRY